MITEINSRPPKLSILIKLQWFLGVVLFGVILTLGWFLLCQPIWQEISTQDKPLDNELALNKIKTEYQKVKTLNDQYKVVNESQAKRLQLALPQGPDLPNLMAILEGIAKDQGLAIENMNFSFGAPTGVSEENEDVEKLAKLGIKTMNINVSLGPSTYGEMKKFVKAAEDSIRLINLKSLTFNVGIKGNKNGYNLNFDSTYLEQ